MMNSAALEAETAALLLALKEVLRERRIGYRDIAVAMDLSLPTVKRMLNKKSLPLDRLLSLCRLAGIDPAQVFVLAEKKRPKHTMFTAEQDALFDERPECLSYFSRLVYEGKTPDEIAAEEGLSSLSTERYLSLLAKVGLLERQTENKIKLSVEPPLGFGPESKVLRAQHATFLQEIVRQVLDPEGEKHVFALLKPLSLDHESYREMLAELSTIVDKYAHYSENSAHHGSADHTPWKLAVAAGPSQLGDIAPAPILEMEP